MPRRRNVESPGRDALLDAAVAVIARDGFRGLTYRTVADEAKVTHGLVTYHFGTLDALVHEALTRRVRQAIERASIGAGNRHPEDFARRLIALAREEPAAQLAQFELVLEARRRPALTEHVRELYRTYTDAVAGALAELGAPAEGATARLVFAALDGLMLRQLILGETDDNEAALDVLRAIVATLAAPSDDSDPASAGTAGTARTPKSRRQR